MVGQRRTPGVQDQRHTDLRAEMLGVGGDGAQRLRGELEQQVVDHRLVVVGDGTDRRRQREHQVVVVDRQQVGLPRFQPPPRGTRLALRAVPVAAGVVGDLDLITGVAAQYMSPQRRAAALFDGRHHLELTEAQVAVLRSPPGRPVGAEDVRDLHGGAPHRAALRGYRVLQRTDHLAQQVGRHLGIKGRRVQFLVPEQHLDDPDVDLLLQQMGGEAVPLMPRSA